MKYFIGIDIGGTNIAAGVVNEKYELLNSLSQKTNAPRPAINICNDISLLCKKASSDAGISWDEIIGIGIACPGIIKNGIVRLASNLEFENVDIRGILSDITGKPVAVCNDANAAALAECRIGSGKGFESLVAVTIGTGIGGGIVIGGKIFEGFNGAGAEIGHIVIIPEGRQCTCGSKGCFEQYCSATALKRDAGEAMLADRSSKLWEICQDVTNVSGEAVYSAAKAGDRTAKAVLNNFVRYLSIGVTNIITLLQPAVVCIGGGMSCQGNDLIEPLVDLVNKSGIIKTLSQKTKITAAVLHNDAGIIGAAINIAEE